MSKQGMAKTVNPKVSRHMLKSKVLRLALPSTQPQSTASENTIPDANRDFLDRFAKNELEHRAKLAEQGQLVDSGVLAERMGLTRQAINKAVADMRMFALVGVSGKKHYPAFFADDSLDRRQLQAVSKELGHLAGSSKWQFFTNPRLSLGKKTPVEALRKGKYSEVLAAAAAFREA